MSGRDFIGRGNVVMWPVGATVAKNVERGSPKREIGLLSNVPVERIALDIMGPLPQSNSDNSYILVIGDYFSKYTEVYALPDHTAQTVARVVVEQWICRYGVPRIIHSDQGRDFESHLFTEMFRLLDIEKTKTCPYRPQSDGMIKRFNRTVAQMLATFVKGCALTFSHVGVPEYCTRKYSVYTKRAYVWMEFSSSHRCNSRPLP